MLKDNQIIISQKAKLKTPFFLIQSYFLYLILFLSVYFKIK